MKTTYMLTYCTKILLVTLLTLAVGNAQNATETKKDSTIFKQKYGLRLGADVSKLVRTFVDNNYSGFELMGDYRLTSKIYLAGEIGTEERTIISDALENTTSGSYFKAGIDINLYKNWLDMENMIYTGFRVGASTFSQTLDNYAIYNVNNQYFNQQFVIDDPQNFDGLTAVWADIIIGIKAEIFNNLFIGINAQLKYLISDTDIPNYENLYIPGYNRTYDSSKIGAGYGLNIGYLIPIYKKNKIVVTDKE